MFLRMRYMPALPALLLFLLLTEAQAAVPRSLAWSLDAIEVQGRGDSLSVALTWTFSNWEIPAQKAMVFSPALRNGDLFASLTPVSVYGSKIAPQAGKLVASGNPQEIPLVSFTKPFSIRVEDVVPRSEWMDTVKVTLAVSEWSKRDGLVLRSTSQRGLFTKPPRPDEFVFPWTVFEPKDSPDSFTELSFSVPVKFDDASNKFEISFQEDREAWDGFISEVRAFSSARKVAVRGSSLVLTVPPTGVAKETVKLSQARVKSLYSFLQGQGCFKVNQASRIGGGDDWKGVYDWVAASRFAGDERLMEILSWEGKGDAKAGALRSEKPVIWGILQEDCFPGLGHAEYIVSFLRPQFQAASDVLSYYNEMPEALSPHDFWLLSTLYTKGYPEWLDVICTGARLHPEDVELNLDAAFGLIADGRFNAASEFLRYGGDDERYKYAMAVWFYKTGRLDEAIEVMQYLRRRSVTYGPILDDAVPFIQWQTCTVPWERYYP